MKRIVISLSLVAIVSVVNLSAMGFDRPTSCPIRPERTDVQRATDRGHRYMVRMEKDKKIFGFIKPETLERGEGLKQELQKMHLHELLYEIRTGEGSIPVVHTNYSITARRRLMF